MLEENTGAAARNAVEVASAPAFDKFLYADSPNCFPVISPLIYRFVSVSKFQSAVNVLPAPDIKFPGAAVTDDITSEAIVDSGGT